MSGAGQPVAPAVAKVTYVYQLRKPDGTLETRAISVDEKATAEQRNTIAKANAQLHGGTIVAETLQRQKFTVAIVNGLTYPDIEANSETEAENIAKSRFAQATGVNPSTLQASARKLEIGEDPSRQQAPQEYKVVYFDDANHLITKEDAIRLESEGRKVNTIIVSPDQKTQIASNRAEAELLVEQQNIRLKQERLGKDAQSNSVSQGIRQIPDKDRNGIQYAQGRDGKIYQFDEASKTYKPISGNTYEVHSTIGEGADTIRVLKTVDAKTKATTKIEATDKAGTTITLDRETLRQIEQSGGKDVVFEKIPTTEFEEEGFKFTRPGQEKITFTDKNGNLVEITKSENYGEIKDGKITGTKTQVVSRQVFVDEFGKYLTPEQAAERKKEGLPVLERTEQISGLEEVDGKATKFTIITSTQVKRDGLYVTIEESRPIDMTTGKRTGEYRYSETDKDGKKVTFSKNANGIWFDENGRALTGVDGNVLPGISLTPELLQVLNNGKKEDSQYKSRQFFANLERVFTEYRGLNYFTSLFYDEETLLEWRRDVDKFFTENYLGIEAWTSQICEEKIERGPGQGVAYAETPQGLPQIGAHIEATRTQPLVNLSDSKISYIYKITFNVRNGDYETDVRAPENMKVNVIIKGHDAPPSTEAAQITKEVKLFKRDIEIPRGTAFGKMGATAIVKETKNYYSRICLKFSEIPSTWKVDDNEICNVIVESAGEPTTIQTQQQQQAQQSTEGELEDF